MYVISKTLDWQLARPLLVKSVVTTIKKYKVPFVVLFFTSQFLSLLEYLNSKQYGPLISLLFAFYETNQKSIILLFLFIGFLIVEPKISSYVKDIWKKEKKRKLKEIQTIFLKSIQNNFKMALCSTEEITELVKKTKRHQKEVKKNLRLISTVVFPFYIKSLVLFVFIFNISPLMSMVFFIFVFLGLLLSSKLPEGKSSIFLVEDIFFTIFVLIVPAILLLTNQNNLTKDITFNFLVVVLSIIDCFTSFKFRRFPNLSQLLLKTKNQKKETKFIKNSDITIVNKKHDYTVTLSFNPGITIVREQGKTFIANEIMKKLDEPNLDHTFYLKSSGFDLTIRELFFIFCEDITDEEILQALDEVSVLETLITKTNENVLDLSLSEENKSLNTEQRILIQVACYLRGSFQNIIVDDCFKDLSHKKKEKVRSILETQSKKHSVLILDGLRTG